MVGALGIPPAELALGYPMTIDFPPQISTLKDQLDAASEKAAAIIRSAPVERLTTRPISGGWSAVECLIHLNLTTKQYIPLINAQIVQARADGLESAGPFRMDWTGRFLAWFLEPPYRKRSKTMPGAIPDRPRPPGPVLEELRALNNQLIALLQDANGLSFEDIKIVSPFNGRVKYNLYSTFRILTAHERRHLWQAEKTLETL